MAAIASPVVVDTMTTPATAAGPSRLDSVDLLRGIVMVIMVLDHTRDFVHGPALRSDPTDLATTSAAIFMTRWITHFCAPVFVFLAGVSVYLQKMRGKSPGELSRFLVTRGIWLIAIEIVVLHLGPALLALAWFESSPPGWWSRPLVVFGRVPLFFYLLQWPLAHGAGILTNGIAGKSFAYLFLSPPAIFNAPPGGGFRLWVVYVCWACIVLVEYPLCRWFAAVKQRRRDPWLSYL